MQNRKWLWLLLIPVTILLLGIFGKSLRDEYLEAKARASVHEARAVFAEQQIDVLLGQKDQDRLAKEKLQADLDKALANRRPAPPPIPDSPSTSPEVVAELALAGLVVRVPEAGENTLVLQDARKALQWHYAALRLPQATDALAREKEALETSLRMTAAVAKELATCNEVVAAQSEAYQGRMLQIGELKKETSALEKRLKVVTWKKNLTLAVAVPVTAFLVWKAAGK